MKGYRRLALALVISGAICMTTAKAEVIQIDPALSVAIGAQTAELKKLYDNRSKLQTQIVAAEATITLTMDRVHAVENKMLEYLSNASAAVQNLHQIKQAAQLVSVDIPRNINKLSSSVKHNMKGTVIALFVSNKITDTYTEMATLLPFMSQLVTSGSYDIDKRDENGNMVVEKKKVNLLNAAERYYIANEVVTRLKSISNNLFILAWQISTLNLNDLFFKYDVEGWMNLTSGKIITEQVIRDWKNFATRW